MLLPQSSGFTRIDRGCRSIWRSEIGVWLFGYLGGTSDSSCALTATNVMSVVVDAPVGKFQLRQNTLSGLNGASMVNQDLSPAPPSAEQKVPMLNSCLVRTYSSCSSGSDDAGYVDLPPGNGTVVCRTGSAPAVTVDDVIGPDGDQRDWRPLFICERSQGSCHVACVDVLASLVCLPVPERQQNAPSKPGLHSFNQTLRQGLWAWPDANTRPGISFLATDVHLTGLQPART